MKKILRITVILFNKIVNPVKIINNSIPSHIQKAINPPIKLQKNLFIFINNLVNQYK